MTQTTSAQGRAPRIRLGMVGGGQGAFIGAVHRIAARLDDQYELVAGCFSSTPEKSAASAAVPARMLSRMVMAAEIRAAGVI